MSHSTAAKTISVAIATYNGVNYLAEQLESILKQTRPAADIIIVDDCSQDGTWQLLHRYQQKYSRVIKIFCNNQNIGACKTFERAVNLTSGDYVALADQDDIWLETKLALLVNEIGDGELIHSDAIVINNQQQVINPSLLALIGFKADCTFFERLLREGVHGCCLMMSRKVANLAKTIPDGFVFHDFYYNLVAAASGKVLTYPGALIYYRVHDNNACGLDTKISYARLTALYHKNLNNMQLLAHDPLFCNYTEAITFYIGYYQAILELKPCKISFIYQVVLRLGTAKGVALLLVKIFGSGLLQTIYNLQAKWRKD